MKFSAMAHNAVALTPSAVLSAAVSTAAAVAATAAAASASADAEGKAAGDVVQAGAAVVAKLPVGDALPGKVHQFIHDLGTQFKVLTLQADGLMTHVAKTNLLGAWAGSLLANPLLVPEATLLQSAQGIAALAHTEEFQMRRDELLAAPVLLPALCRAGSAAGSQVNVASESKSERSNSDAVPTEATAVPPTDGTSILEALAGEAGERIKALAPSFAVKKTIRPLLDLAAFCKRQTAKAKK